MALSSLSVVASSLALHLYRPPKVAAVAAAISRRTKNKRGGYSNKDKDKDSDDTVNTNDDDKKEKVPVRRSGRKTARELMKEGEEKVAYQLRQNTDEGLGLEKKEDIPDKGRGVVTTRARVQGEFICEYAGKVIDMEKARTAEFRRG